jgi:hypothetical protein
MDAPGLERRQVTYRRFAALGRAPAAAEVASALDRDEAAVRAGWRRLHDAHGRAG